MPLQDVSLDLASLRARDSHDTASGSATGVTGLERVGVAALAEVVGALVDDDGSANDRVRADKRDRAVCASFSGFTSMHRGRRQLRRR